ncbi:MAG: hypothetical protein ACOY90_19455 [Candidatus Zhuqueibacterota bacterium]
MEVSKRACGCAPFGQTGPHQPYGGNVDTDMTFDPRLYFVVGVAL